MQLTNLRMKELFTDSVLCISLKDIMSENYLRFSKKVKKWLCSSSRYEQIPSSLAECLDEPVSTRREPWRFWLIILLILPTLYYMHDNVPYHKLGFSYPNLQKDIILLEANKTFVSTTPTSKVTTESVRKEMTNRNLPDKLPVCIVDKSLLGNFYVRTPRNNLFLENEYLSILKGGYYLPIDCQPRHKVGVLVPYRDREENLLMFIYNIHPFLMKQKLEYRIFVVEQKGTDKFNKGRLFNAGFEEMKKYGSWHCIVFHDVDLIPLDERILYSCPSWPRHMCATVVQKLYNPSYRTLFGGVTSMTPWQYEKVNGYSNLYWGWGGEDHDMFWRLRFAGLPVTRYNKTIARYTTLPHLESSPNPLRYLFLRGGLGKYRQEGLSTLEYKLVSVTEKHLFTHLVVDINPARDINANPIKLSRKFQD